MLKTTALQILKATCAAVVFSLLSVLAFTLIIQLASLTDAVIKPVSQVCKILAIAGGGLLFIRGEKGLIKGLIYGVCAVLVNHLLFSLIGGSFTFGWQFLLELLIGAICGAVCALLAVNVIKS